jgi:CheY-like chemotaxis protein
MSATRLLLVDDNMTSARGLATLLEDDGYIVNIASDGGDAIRRMAEDPMPDAIVTDLIMPTASGIAVLGEARRRWKEIPVIFITGHPDLVRPSDLPFLPTPHVFTKPIAYDEFHATLRALLAARLRCA